MNPLAHLRQPAAALIWLAPDCSVADNPLHCRLLTWLWALEATAGVLALLLIVAAAFAWIAFRRNKTRRLSQNQPGSDRP